MASQRLRSTFGQNRAQKFVNGFGEINYAYQLLRIKHRAKHCDGILKTLLSDLHLGR